MYFGRKLRMDGVRPGRLGNGSWFCGRSVATTQNATPSGLRAGV
jgi:hypothetical protein